MPSSLPDAANRLRRLEGYLQEDPSNLQLLADACDAALACGEHARAQAHAERGEQLDPSPEWTLRRAQACIARRSLPEAVVLLESLRARDAVNPVIAHDLAYVRLLQGECEATRRLLEPWMTEVNAVTDTVVLQALQVAWLRALHRLQRLDEAWQWILLQQDKRILQAAAHGAASLIAVDLGEMEAARGLADAALAADATQHEALVARASVALAQGETPLATALVGRALELHPDDGRTWSTLGYASLQAGELREARRQLECAVLGMPDHIGTWHALGWACLLLGDRDAAQAAFEQALGLDRNFAESHGAVGLAMALRGDDAGAERHLELAEKLDPLNVTGRYARALLAGEAGDAQRLQALAARLLDRPGFFGKKLREALPATVPARLA
jgi:Flp pilus assembly protein TadD